MSDLCQNVISVPRYSTTVDIKKDIKSIMFPYLQINFYIQANYTDTVERTLTVMFTGV